MWSNVNIDTQDRLYQVSVTRALTPNYFRLVASDSPLPDLPYSLSITEHPGPISIHIRDYLFGKLYTDYGVKTYSMKSNDPLWSVGEEKARQFVATIAANRRNKLLSKVKGQSLPLLMLYKERHQTGKLVTKFLDDMLYCATHIRNPKAILRRYGYRKQLTPSRLRRLRVYASRGTTTIGNAWLQYRFAWSPLLADIEASLQAAALSEKKGKGYKVTAGLPFQTSFPRTSRKQDGVTGQTGSFSVEGAYHITCRYFISDATLAIGAQIQNVEFTVWDSVPYSFIVDRLVNIGKYLDLRYATAGVGFSSGHETTFYKCKAVYDATNVYDYYDNLCDRTGNYFFVSEFSGPSKTNVRLNRSVLTTFPEATLEYPYKDFVGSASRIADLAALVLQRFKLKI